MAINPETAKKLLDSGAINQATYERFVPATPTTPAEEEEVVSMAAKAKPEGDEPSWAVKSGLLRPEQAEWLGEVGDKISGAWDKVKGKPLDIGSDTGFSSRIPAEQLKAEATQSVQPQAPVQPELGNANNMTLASDIPAPVDPNIEFMKQQQQKREGILGQMTAGYNMQQKAVREAAAAGAAQAEAEAAHLKTTYDEAERSQKEIEARDAERKSRLAQDEGKLRDAMEKLNATPATFAEKFAKMDTGDKIVNGIALFLGSAPNSSGGNKALDVMQKAVDADIDRAKKDVDNKKSLYSEMKDTFKDERAAEAATRLAYIQNAQLKLQQIASQYKAPQLKANAEAMYGQLEVAKRQQMMNFAQASTSAINPMLAQADELTKNIYRLPKELQGKALEEKGIIEGLDKATEALNESYKTVGKVGFELNPWSKDSASRDAAKSTIMATVVANWKGPMSDSDMQRVEGLMPQNGDTVAQVEQKRQQMDSLVRSNSKPTPILNGFRIAPKTQEQKYPDRKPN